MIEWTDHKHNLPASFRDLMKAEQISEAFLSPFKGILGPKMGENTECWSQYLKNYLEFWHEVKKNIESSELRAMTYQKIVFRAFTPPPLLWP